jgi:hypothetical protein
MTIICACGRTFKTEASLVTHLEANPEHWRPGNIPNEMKTRIDSKLDK